MSVMRYGDGPRAPSPGRAPARWREYAAWLLRTSRRAASDERVRIGRRFATAFRGDCWPRQVGPSTVSRWENAVLPVPRAAILRYEELLGIVPGTLSAPIDTYRRYTTMPLEQPVGVADRGHQQDDLVELALSDNAMDGRQWDSLTEQLRAADLRVVPGSNRAVVVERLVTETLTADGIEWMQRFEALNRLLTHPRWRDVVIATCVAAADEPANPAVVEAVCALDGTGHPDAARHVVRRLVSPVSAGAFYGALLACVRKIRFNHFSDAQVAVLGGVCADVVADTGRSDDAPVLAAELLRRLSYRRVPMPPLGSRHVEAIRRTGPIGRLRGAREAAAACGRVIGEIEDDDPVLLRLVDDVLHSPVYDVRLYSAMVLRASPHRWRVAEGIGRELASGRPVDPRQLSPLLNSLRVLGTPDQRTVVEHLVMTSARSPVVAVSAAHALAHVEGRSSPAFWLSAVQHYAGLLTRPATGSVARAVLPCLVYGIGIAREAALLRRVRDDCSMPEVVRAAAAWWRP